MRYLKKYNEAVETKYTPMIDVFIEGLLEYKSEFIDNLELKDQQWEVRQGYAPRKTITFDNKISNKQESIAIEDHSGRMCIRLFWNNSYQNDASFSDISGYDKSRGDRSFNVIKSLFSRIEGSSKSAKDYFRQMEIVKSVIPKISEDEIKENFADIIDLSNSYNITTMVRGGYETSKRVTIGFSKKICNLKSPGLEITMDDDNQVIIQEIISATNRIKEEYNIMTTVTFGEREIIIDLNVIDPTTGKKIG